MKRSFDIETPDMATSPFTGMSRSHWREAGKWFVEGIFSHVTSGGGPVPFPRVPGRSYPHPGDPSWRVDSAQFEAVVRSLNLAGPLIEEEPELTVNGFAVGDFYKTRLLALTAPMKDGGLPRPDDLPDLAIQMTCEAGGLAAILTLCPGLWARFSSGEKEQIVGFLSAYAHARTGGHNWRYFNVMMLFFLLREGHEADESLFYRHWEALLCLHVGDGWFWDIHVDYYSHWVFQLYGAILRDHGKDFLDPGLIARSLDQARALAAGYPRMFSRRGHMILWGRSICYRTGAAAVFPLLCSGPEPLVDPGWARRIVSGNLLQFATNEAFMENGLPALGFYGHFEPVLQPYSCTASPMWMHLTFLSALSQPADAPFWTARENEGEWERWERDNEPVCSLTMPGAAIRLVNYVSTGETEMQTAQVEITNPLYQRLAFHSRYLAEEPDPVQGMAMHYSWVAPHFFKGRREFHGPFRNDWCGEEDGVLYRRLQMSDTVHGTYPYIDLAEIAVERGVLRMDRPRVFHGERMRLCHYALPHLDGIPEIEERGGEGWQALIASTRTDSLTLVSFSGWQRLGHFEHADFNPHDVPSTVLFAEQVFDSLYPDCGLPFLAALLHRSDGKAWSDEDLRLVSGHGARFVDDSIDVSASDGSRREITFGKLRK